MKIKGKLYQIYPVWVIGQNCEAIEESWQWRYLGWLLPLFHYSMGFCCDLLDCEPQFPIKIDKNQPTETEYDQ